LSTKDLPIFPVSSHFFASLASEEIIDLSLAPPLVGEELFPTDELPPFPSILLLETEDAPATEDEDFEDAAEPEDAAEELPALPALPTLPTLAISKTP
jgi:hypothetical protein